jgi:peptidoglycan lytic transglycosylase
VLIITRFGRSLAGAVLLALIAIAPQSCLAADDSAIAAAAFDAGDRGNWADARSIAGGAFDPVIPKLFLWLDATRRQGGGTFEEITGFIIDNPDWPYPKTLRLRAEQAIDDSTSDLAILSWFQRNEPLTLPGAKRYAYALIANGDEQRAADVARAAWVSADAQTIDDEDTFYIAFHDVLTNADHAGRIDRLIWAGRTSAAERLLSRLDSDNRALAEARIALRQQRDDAPNLVAVVPDYLQGDPGLIYERVRWHRRKGSDSLAEELLTQFRGDAVQPDDFWQERSILSRRALADGDPSRAYALASEHGFTNGSEMADSEWLAGWIALRFLHRPDAAQRHFLTMFENVTHPVSRARGAYWSGRAAAELGEKDGALLWYKAGAQHPVAFYGQLSAAEVRPQQPLRLPPDPPVDPAEMERFQNHDLLRALRLLVAAGQQEPIRAFVLRLAELDDSASWKNLVAAYAHDVGRPELGVAVARQSIRGGIPLIRNGYPTLPVAAAYSESMAPAETALVFAMVRQESAFDVHARSSAGARGLMQLMPGTARDVANRLGMPYAPSDLTNSPDYNVSLGRAYIGGLIDRFDGSYVLALAGYNAGPGRVNQWLQSNGDPRAGTEAAVDWIELIPFTETRNYVQRCLENLQVYRTLLGTAQLAQATDRDLLR